MRKRNNKAKLNKSLENIVNSGIIMLSVRPAINGYVAYNINTMQEVDAKPFLQRRLESIECKWSIILAVFHRDSINGETAEYEEMISPVECGYKALAQSLSDNHARMIEESNKNTICGIGWIVSPTEIQITDEQLTILFSKYRAYSRLAAWEVEQEK